VRTAKIKRYGSRVMENGSRPEPKLALRDKLKYIKRVVNSSIVCGKGAFGSVVRYIVESAVNNHNGSYRLRISLHVDLTCVKLTSREDCMQFTRLIT
jgi:hypothetical protein